jgi:hypothetical protein
MFPGSGLPGFWYLQHLAARRGVKRYRLAAFRSDFFLIAKEFRMSSSQNSPLSRRDLLRLTAHIGPAIPLLSFGAAAIAQTKPATPAPAAPAAPAAGTCEPVSLTDPVVKSMQYVADGTKAPNRPKKMDTEGKDQTCANCQLYVKQGDGKGEEFGKCTMFPKGCVQAKGWCMAWVKKH